MSNRGEECNDIFFFERLSLIAMLDVIHRKIPKTVCTSYSLAWTPSNGVAESPLHFSYPEIIDSSFIKSVYTVNIKK